MKITFIGFINVFKMLYRLIGVRLLLVRSIIVTIGINIELVIVIKVEASKVIYDSLHMRVCSRASTENFAVHVNYKQIMNYIEPSLMHGDHNGFEHLSCSKINAMFQLNVSKVFGT